jgi:hypothetical protein
MSRYEAAAAADGGNDDGVAVAVAVEVENDARQTTALDQLQVGAASSKIPKQKVIY